MSFGTVGERVSSSIATRIDGAESAIASRVLLQCLVESALVEVRPEAVDEMQLGVCALPEHEIAESLLAASADQQVDLRRGQCHVVDCGERLGEARTIDAVCRSQPTADFDEAVLCRIVHGNTQTHAGAMRRGAFAALDQVEQLHTQAVATADDVDADRLLDATPRLCLQMLLEQRKQAADFIQRALPVRSRECVQRQRPDPPPRRRFDDPVDRIRARAMAERTRQKLAQRPAAVTVHGDFDMHWRVLCITKLMGKKIGALDSQARRVALITASTWSR